MWLQRKVHTEKEAEITSLTGVSPALLSRPRQECARGCESCQVPVLGLSELLTRLPKPSAGEGFGVAPKARGLAGGGNSLCQPPAPVRATPPAQLWLALNSCQPRHRSFEAHEEGWPPVGGPGPRPRRLPANALCIIAHLTSLRRVEGCSGDRASARSWRLVHTNTIYS